MHIRRIATLAICTILAVFVAFSCTGCGSSSEDNHREVVCQITDVDGSSAVLKTGYVTGMMVDGEPVMKFVENGYEIPVNIGAATIAEGKVADADKQAGNESLDWYIPDSLAELDGRIANVSIAGKDMVMHITVLTDVTLQNSSE